MTWRKLKFRHILFQMEQIGVNSFWIVVLTGSFTGMVFAFQSYVVLQKLAAEQLVGSFVAVGMVRELGPVLSGLMVVGRAGSAITAEIATMQVTEQVEALRVLHIHPFQYLIVPRVIAGLCIMPFLTIFGILFGILGGLFVVTHVLGLYAHDYLNSFVTSIDSAAIVTALVKSALFGLGLSFIGCYVGYNSAGGARAVGIATTRGVVAASLFILVCNYLITRLLEAAP